jgi:uncharacterized protein YjbI with pentapeptide repeats
MIPTEGVMGITMPVTLFRWVSETMPNLTRVLWAAVGTLALVFFAAEDRAAENEWTWRDRDGKTKSLGDLRSILDSHKTWIESDGQSGSQAMLSGADLHGADLRGVELSEAQLGNANLFGANLDGSTLRGAVLLRADLSESQLTLADCRGADLDATKLVHARLWGSTFYGATFRGADLTQALLFDRRPAPPTGLVAVVAVGPARSHVPKVTVPPVGSGSITPPSVPHAQGPRASLEFANLKDANLSQADLGYLCPRSAEVIQEHDNVILA